MEEEGCDRDDALDVEEVAGFVMAVVVEVVLKVFDVPEHRGCWWGGRWRRRSTGRWQRAPAQPRRGKVGLTVGAG